MWVYEDIDRMCNAQAMLTAAQASIQEFDPILRLEYERWLFVSGSEGKSIKRTDTIATSAYSHTTPEDEDT